MAALSRVLSPENAESYTYIDPPPYCQFNAIFKLSQATLSTILRRKCALSGDFGRLFAPFRKTLPPVFP
jgi:hypothetical protein